MNRRTWVYICLIVLMLVLLGLSFFFSNITVFNWYQHHIYLPYQQLRSLIFNYIPFSIGDILYVILFLALIWAVARLVKRIVRVRSNPQALKLILGRFVLSLTGFYILYFFSWGANYSRPKIWQPKVDTVWNQERLLALNLMLVKELNEEIVQQKERSAAELNSLLYAQYQDFLGQDITVVKAKASIFGDAINYLGIQGYFNPITGEAQLTFGLPRQMWPFVMAHEMAHQVGIAAEGEANFMAYAICVKSADANIIYSGHFNLFLYANRELARTDSLLAHGLYLQLNDKTKDEIKELKEKRAQYKSVFRGTALDIYDWMLQSQGQRKGIRSYGEISRLVYLWELEGAPKLKLNK